jgi:AAA+ superfamily predicted ATPase
MVMTVQEPFDLGQFLASFKNFMDKAVEQAIEIPLPDHACRRRLFDLYGQGLTLRLERLSELIEQTKGVSAAFIRELMRKAALFAAEEGEEIIVEDRHIDEALKELVFEGGELTKRLLGASRAF